MNITLIGLSVPIILAGGKIVCIQCTAKSKRTGEQCKAPALRISKTHKCRVNAAKSP